MRLPKTIWAVKTSTGRTLWVVSKTIWRAIEKTQEEVTDDPIVEVRIVGSIDIE